MFRYHYFPFVWLVYLGLIVLFLLAIALVEVGVLSYAYSKMGVSRRWVYAILALCLLGSSVNIPVAELGGQPQVTAQEFTFWGVTYRVPQIEVTKTIVAVNLGGAVIPTLLAVYLMVRNRLYLESLLGILAVGILVHLLAKPVQTVGVVVPFFIPPIAAALIAVLLSRDRAAPLAYVVGTIGTLVGADLSNLDKIQALGAPMMSIGGAGTFDGVFLTGILAVLLA
jgi:uncharacterized membrane protein